VESLEYEFSAAFSELMSNGKQTVAFLKGQGELNENETHDIVEALSERYVVRKVSVQELESESAQIKTLIVANPTLKFSENDKFQIDQYLMSGGRIIWLINPVSVSLDSLSKGNMTLAFPQNLNLDDQLFRYGIRLNSNLVQDAECLLLPVNTAPAGSPAKFTPAPWYYSPLLSPSDKHVISRNLNRIKADFVSSIDTVGNQKMIHKTVILATSAYSLVSQTPLEISLSSINNPPDRRLFRDPSQPVGVLLEGIFTSVFKNRMVESFGAKASKVKTESPSTKMVVFSNGNLIANQFRMSNGVPEYMPLGYDRYSQQTFGNRDLLLNTVNYLCDDEGLMNLRSRVFKIRLLDKVRIKEGRLIWQIVNVMIPLLIISLFGAVYVYVRRRKYRC